jgi:ferric-dicitrate binding protein FerR (iron transport regulator)
MARKRKNQARHKAHCRRQRGFITLEIMVWMAAAIAVWSIALGLVMESRRVTSSNHRETVRCVDGSLSKVTNSGMATPVLDRTGKTIACPLT